MAYYRLDWRDAHGEQIPFFWHCVGRFDYELLTFQKPIHICFGQCEVAKPFSLEHKDTQQVYDTRWDEAKITSRVLIKPLLYNVKFYVGASLSNRRSFDFNCVTENTDWKYKLCIMDVGVCITYQRLYVCHRPANQITKTHTQANFIEERRKKNALQRSDLIKLVDVSSLVISCD